MGNYCKEKLSENLQFTEKYNNVIFTMNDYVICAPLFM